MCDPRLFVVRPKSGFTYKYFDSNPDTGTAVGQSNPDSIHCSKRVRIGITSTTDSHADAVRSGADDSAGVPKSGAKSRVSDRRAHNF